MSITLAEALSQVDLQPGRVYREAVNGNQVEVHVSADDQPTPELAEQVMMLPWWDVPFCGTAVVTATPGPVSWPDPPIISPLDQEP